MSFDLVHKVFKREFSEIVIQNKDGSPRVVSASACKFVLLALVDHANSEGVGAYPAISTLERETALSRQTVIYALRALKSDGFIFVAGKTIYRTNSYSINIQKLDRPEAKIQEKPDAIVYPVDQHESTQYTDVSLPSRPKQSINSPLTPASSDKIRAVCNASPAWAIGHGEVPTQITEEQRELDSINQFPQQFRGFAEVYILGTKRLATKNEIGRWGKAFSEMSDKGVTPEILSATILEMRNKGLTNTWPGSCTNMAAAKVAGRKRVEVEAPAPLEDIFSRPAFIPENRWRKATQ